MRFNTTEDQVVRDMGGERVVKYYGHCQRCNSSLYAMPTEGDGFDADPRGILGIHHCYYPASAEEYNMTGPDVKFCYDCFQGQNETYQQCLAIAKHYWRS